MSKRAHLSFGRIVPVTAILLLAIACGDDDGGGGKDAGPSTSGKGGGGGGSTAGSSSAGKSGSSGGSAGASGQTGSGILTEGDQCKNTAECGAGLTCLTAEVQGTPVLICARLCADDNACGKSDAGGAGEELCLSPYTELARDAHCINFEPEAYAYCGVGFTAACDGTRQCLYFPNQTIGICVDLCTVDPTQDAGSDVPRACPTAGQACVSGVVADEAVGVCGKNAGRDAECGIELGIFCTGTDICVPDDLSADEGPQHCREDCTETGACTSGGACTSVSNRFAYCKK